MKQVIAVSIGYWSRMRKLFTICALCLIMQGCTSMKVPYDLALGVLLIESNDDGLKPSYIVVEFPF